MKMSVLNWYLAAFFFYSMGVQTVMLAATMFGSKMLGLPTNKLIITVVLIQLVAVFGAFLMSRLIGYLRKSFGINVCGYPMDQYSAVSAYAIATLKEGGEEVEFYFYWLATGVGLSHGWNSIAEPEYLQ